MSSIKDQEKLILPEKKPFRLRTVYAKIKKHLDESRTVVIPGSRPGKDPKLSVKFPKKKQND